MSVINNVLDISKIEAGRLELEQVDFDLGPLMLRAAALVRDKIQTKGLSFEIETPPGLTHRLRGEPTRLTQALLNYLGNAVKFSRAGQHVITLRRVGSEQQSDFIAF